MKNIKNHIKYKLLFDDTKVVFNSMFGYLPSVIYKRNRVYINHYSHRKLKNLIEFYIDEKEILLDSVRYTTEKNLLL